MPVWHAPQTDFALRLIWFFLSAKPVKPFHTGRAMPSKSPIKHEIVPLGGWKNNLALSNDVCELLITLEVGPRILSFAPKNGRNMFKIVEKQLGGTGEEIWRGRGGHRLWLAPEGFPFSYFPDNDPVDHTVHDNGSVTLVAADEMPQGFSKQMDVSLHPTKARVRVNHRLVNVVDEAQVVAPWMLSVMDAGGIGIVPQPPAHDHPGLGPGDFTPDRSLVLWPFTNLSDPRYYLGQKFWTVAQHVSGEPTKVGLNSPVSWAAYYLDGTLFVKRWSFDPKADYPDRGCAFELYTDEDILELESLAPLVTLKPGGVVEAVEEWELFENVGDFDPRDDDSIEEMIRSVGL